MSWPAVLLWIMIIFAAFSQGPWLIYILFASSAFGMLQMVPSDGVGNLLPQSVCAAVFVTKVLLSRGNIPRAVDAALDPSRLGLLTAFTVYGIIGAYSLPRLFAGLTDVVPVSGSSAGTESLRPSIGNVTQSCYMILSFATTLAFSVVGGTDKFRRHYILANIYAGMTVIATGLIDLACYKLGLSDILTPFRTATYALLSDAEVEGVKRVVGLMSEASTYGGLCVGTGATLVFLHSFLSRRRERLLAVFVGVLVLGMGVLSTSSGAYVGLAILLAIYGFSIIIRLTSHDRREIRRSHIELGIFSLLIIALISFYIVDPESYDPAYDMVDKIVFQKTITASYIERSSWTQAGWQAFIDSGGMGVGIGSLRVSNWTVSIIGSTGVFGAALMFMFLFQQVILRPQHVSPHVRKFCIATQISLLPSLVVSQLSATMPDLGIAVAAALGMLAAPRRQQNDLPAPAKSTEEAHLDCTSG